MEPWMNEAIKLYLKVKARVKDGFKLSKHRCASEFSAVI